MALGLTPAQATAGTDPAIAGLVFLYNETYSEAKNRPIKGYLQVVSIFLYVTAGIVMVAIVAEAGRRRRHRHRPAHGQDSELGQDHHHGPHPPVHLRVVPELAGTFRAYVIHYLRSHPHIHQDMTLLARQLEPGADGALLQICCFTNDTVWANYEGIQGDIFDHLIAILPEFGLRPFQQPVGSDFRRWGAGAQAAD